MRDMSRKGMPIVGGAQTGVEERGEGRRPVLDDSPRARRCGAGMAKGLNMGLVEGNRALKVEWHGRGWAVNWHWSGGGSV